jgi:hypothetical protein
MGMSTHVYAFISSDNDTYKKQCKVLQACIDAGIKELPKETADYFGSDYPEHCLFEEVLEIEITAHEYSEDMQEGFEVRISELPEGVETIRFVNSW